MTRRSAVGLSLFVLFACHASTPAATNFDAMMSDPVFSIDVSGTAPTGPVLGNAGSYGPGPGDSPTQAFRSWTVGGDADTTYARVLTALTTRGVTLLFFSCDGKPQPDYIGDGWKIVGDRSASVTVSLQGTKLQISLSSSAGPPQPAPNGRHLQYDGTCPAKTDRVLRSLASP